MSSWNTLTSVVSPTVFNGLAKNRLASSWRGFFFRPGGALHLHLSQRSPQQGRLFRAGARCVAVMLLLLACGLLLRCSVTQYFRFFSCFILSLQRFCLSFCIPCLDLRFSTCSGSMLRKRNLHFMLMILLNMVLLETVAQIVLSLMVNTDVESKILKGCPT